MKLPKINLRDWFWLALVVAMGLGWWLDHQRAESRYNELREWMPLTIGGSNHMRRYRKSQIDAVLKRHGREPL